MGTSDKSKIIIGIHGLGNKAPKEILSRWWRAAIDEGFRNTGKENIFCNFDLFYWADILNESPLDPDEKDPLHPLYLNEPYLPSKSYPQKKPGGLKKTFLDILESIMDKVFLNEDMTINFSSITDVILKKYFSDLNKYYTDKFVDNTGQEMLLKEIIRERMGVLLDKHRQKQILLIAHSMGAIIAYDVLLYSRPNIWVDTFVTMGSPLGLPVVMAKSIAELKSNNHSESRLTTPENIATNWYNLADLQDKVAINYNVSDDYDENSQHVRARDITVVNNYEHMGEKNHHKIYGYLRTPELAEILHTFFQQ